MKAIYKRELRAFFTGMNGYIVIAFILLISGIFITATNLKGGYPQFEYSLSSVGFVLLFVVPILTMRSLAEERHQRTDNLLYSLPMSMTSVVLGKYLAMLTVFAIPVVLMCAVPVILSIYGTISLAQTYASIFGFLLLGAALIAIGMFMSSLTESQVIAAVLGFGSMLLCNLMSGLASLVPSNALASYIAFALLIALVGVLLYYLMRNYWFAFTLAAVGEAALLIVYVIDNSIFVGAFAGVMTWLSLFERLDTFIYYGLFDLTSVVYYLTVAALFVFFTVQSAEKRRWS